METASADGQTGFRSSMQQHGVRYCSQTSKVPTPYNRHMYCTYRLPNLGIVQHIQKHISTKVMNSTGSQL